MIRLYTDEQRNQLVSGDTGTTPIIPKGTGVSSFLKSKTKVPKTSGKIRLFSDEKVEQFKKVDKFNKSVEEAWKLQDESIEQSSFKSLAKETFKPKSLFGAVKKIGTTIGSFGKAVATRPQEVVKGAFESGVLKPISFAQKILQPSVEQKTTTEILGEPKDEEAKKARQVGDFLGWLAPYSAVSKGVSVGVKALTSASKVLKYLPFISDTIGFLGTGQILHEDEESSRLKQLRNDAIALGVFKAGGLVYKGLKPGNTIKGEIDTLLKDVKGLFEKPKKLTVGGTLEEKIKIPIQIERKLLTNKEQKLLTSKGQGLLTTGEIKGRKTVETGKGFTITDKVNKENLNLSKAINDYKTKLASYNTKPTPTKLKSVLKAKQEVENTYIKTIEAKVEQISQTIKEETGSTPKELLQKDISGGVTPEVAPKKVRLYTDAQKSELTGIPKTQAKKLEPVKVEPTKTPKGKPSGIALSIEAKAIEKDLTKGFGELAEFTPVTIKQQAKQMSEIMTKDIEQAKRIATGREPLPKGLKGTTAITAMEKYALKNRDGELMAELAKSPLVSETSIAGQTLRLTAEREKESAVRKIQEVIKAREKGLEQKLKFKKPEKLKSEIKKSLNKTISKAKPNKNSWETLLNELKC